MNDEVSIAMLKLLGGSPVPLPYPDVYNAIQQGVVDGAESDLTVLDIGKHGEVAKAFSFDNHMRLPDYLVISTKTWGKLDSDQKQIFVDAAKMAQEFQINAWKGVEENSIAEGEKMGVSFFEADEKLFRQKVTPIYDEFAKKDKRVQEFVNYINSVK